MNEFECPSKHVWDKRSAWIEREIAEAEKGSHLVSDHATALFMDMQLAFCAGAWITVIVMSVSVIDSHLRETEATDANLGTAKLLSDYYEGPDIDWLRQLRNKYVHHNISKPIFGMNDWFGPKQELEKDATKAMQMTILALFQSWGT